MIANISEFLSAAMEDASTFERAHSCYSATFRSEPYLLGSVSDEDHEFYTNVLKTDFAKVLLASTGIFEPEPKFDEYEEICNYSELENYLEKLDNVNVPELTDDLQICDLCNYKGEGEGFALFLNVKHLPVFKSKNDSYEFFGC
jgi:hypothetical protein